MKGIYDVHCHFVPEVDDGAGSMHEAMALIEKEYKEGVRGIITTPHFRKRMFETSRDEVESSFRQLKEQVTKNYPDLNIYLGCEFHTFHDMPDTIAEDPRYRMLGLAKQEAGLESNIVLLEFKTQDTADYIHQAVYRLRSRGYKVIVAHAERYEVVYGNYELIDELHQIGAYIQVNADSILGRDGWGMKRFCKKLMKLDMIDLVGSDGHNMADRQPHMGDVAKYIERKMGAGYAEHLLIENPEIIFGINH